MKEFILKIIIVTVLTIVYTLLSKQIGFEEMVIVLLSIIIADSIFDKED